MKKWGKMLTRLSVFRYGLYDLVLGLLELRGWRARDKIVWLATIFVHIILFPLGIAVFLAWFATTGLAGSRLGGRVKYYARRLGSVGYTPLFDCVVVSNEGLFRLRGRKDHCVTVTRGYESAVREIFLPKESEVVIDVGAHIGLYTIGASRLVGSTGKVIAIEAEPSNYEALLVNLKLNQTNNVIPLNLAAWNEEARLSLYIGGQGAAHSLMARASKSIKVTARPLDKVLQELGIETVDWVKIDVEGAEVEVLQGMEKTISHSPNLRLLVELHSDETMEKCSSMLTEKGYKVSRVAWHIFASPKEKIDIVAQPEGEYA